MLAKTVKRVLSAILIAVLLLNAFGGSIAASPEKANLKIIDISKWNTINSWQKVAAAVDGVVARIGYRGSVNRDAIVEDDLFAAHLSGALSNNVSFGCYFFSTALSVSRAKQEAQWVIKTLESYNCKPDLPIYIDMEDTTVQNSLTNKQRTDIAKAFCSSLYENGYYAGIYANKYWLTSLLNMSELSSYTIWVAQYGSSCTYQGAYDMWQYTETGTVDGIKGNVDINICYRNFSPFIKKHGFNGYTGAETPNPNNSQDFSKNGTYKIITTSLNVRSGAGAAYQSIGAVAKNTQVYVYDYKDGWGKLSFGSGVGWVKMSGDYLQIVSKHIQTTAGVGFYEITADSLNVRNGPSTSQSKIGYLYKGDSVFISLVSGEWGCYYYGNELKGWIHLGYANFNGVVSFDPNGGKGEMGPQLISNAAGEKLNANAFTLSNSKFMGWALSAQGKAVYGNCALIKMSGSNIILYAIYGNENTFSFKGGVVDKDKKTVLIFDQLLTSASFVSKYVEKSNTVLAEVACKAGGVVGTGSSVAFVCSEKELDKYTIAVLGDINSDGFCDGLDLTEIASLIHGAKKESDFSKEQLLAMDMNFDKKINLSDLELIKGVAFGKSTVPNSL